MGIDKKDSQLGDSLRVQISPTYYFGGKLPATTYSYSVGTQSYFFDAKDYSDYQFGEGYARFDCLYWGQCSFRDSLSAVQKGEIGTNGNGQFDFALPTREKDDNKNDLAEKIYTFNVDVTDPDTGKTVSDSVSSVLHTTDGYAGLKLPYWIDKKSGITGEGILLGLDAAPKSGEISLEFLKHEWKNVKKQGVDGAFYNEYGLEVTSESKTTVSADKNGKFAISYAPKGDGEYEVRASYKGKNGKTYTSSSTVYVDSNSYVSWNNANNSVTEMVAEKNLLKIGETAALTVKSPVKSGNMFVSIEKDDVILKSYVVPITSYSPRIEIPITEDYLPNIYVKVFLVGQDSGMQLPVYKRALSVLKVSTASKKLNIDIKADKQNYLPGSPVTLAVLVTDSLGRPVSGGNGSLSIVDESVLALMGNPKKNPFAFFYDMKRYLGVETMASLAYLIEKLEVKNIGNGEKGGAGDAVK